MDIDEDESETQQAKIMGLELISNNEEREDGSPEVLTWFDKQIVNINTEIEKMAPNLKAMERLGDVETKLAEMEKEVDRAHKDSKQVCDQFNEIKKQRYSNYFQGGLDSSNVL